MIKHKIEDISTGGGCEHLWITFQELGVGVLINNDWTKVPEKGEQFDFGVYHIDTETITGIECMGDYIDGHFKTFHNFDRDTIVAFAYGYLLGNGFEPKPHYSIEDLFSSVNDLYEQFDSGKIELSEVREMLVSCCEQFTKDNKK